jgi:hypothetical protein
MGGKNSTFNLKQNALSNDSEYMVITDDNDCIRKEGIVIFLDALGIKGLGTQKSCEFIKKRTDFLKEIRNIHDKRTIEFKRELDVDLPDLDIALFQDSIIISWEEPELIQQSEDFHFSFFQAAGQFLIDTITEAIRQDLFFRGAISQGEYVVNISNQNVTIIGPAVDDAADFFEIADWVGVIQTPNFQKKYSSYLETIAKKDSFRLGLSIKVDDVIEKYKFLFVKYPVPLSVKKVNKSDSPIRKVFFVSSWPVMACKIESEISIFNILRKKAISEPLDYQSKYSNSYWFLEWYKNQFWDELKEKPGE